MVNLNLNNLLTLIVLQKRILLNNVTEKLKKDSLKKTLRKEALRKLNDLKKFIARTSKDLTEDQVRDIKQDITMTFFKEVNKNIQSSEFTSAITAEVSKIVHSMQKEYWGGSGEIVLQEDPTQLIHKEHLDAIQGEVLRNTKSIVIDPKTGLGSFEAISQGFISGSSTDEGSSTNIPWLRYFLYGHFEGDLIWVNQEVYEIFKGESAGDLGRFGVGYLWNLLPSERKILSAKLQLSGSNINLSDLKHGQSGKAGRDWFADILSKINFSMLVTVPAEESTNKKVLAKWSKKLGAMYKVK